MKAENPELSIVILNYNTRDLTEHCLDSIYEVRDEVHGLQVIVSDNGSEDGSIELVKNKFSWVKVVENGKNLGFAKGNNAAKSVAKGKYVLFLNSDTIVPKDTLKETIGFMNKNPEVGAMTCKLILPDGTLDRDARRRFPTPWVSLSRIFLGNGTMYWYEDVPESKTQEVDVIQGAFFMTRKIVLDDVGWFSEEYFLDGEDIDLCWKIKEKGLKIIYYPKVSITHLKGMTKGKIKRSFGKVTREERIKFVNAGVDSMEIFYRKRLWSRYALPLNLLVILGIRILKGIRFVRALVS